MSDTPCPFCGQIHGTACNGATTTPANPTDRIATTPAYDWREDWNRVQTRIGYDEDAHVDAMHRLAARIERLEAEHKRLEATDDEIDGFYCLADGHTHRNRYAEALCSARYQIAQLEAERDALLAEHEAARRLEHWHPEGCRFCAAHDNAERVIRGE